eukprot:260753-Amphidinium_carterae.1
MSSSRLASEEFVAWLGLQESKSKRSPWAAEIDEFKPCQVCYVVARLPRMCCGHGRGGRMLARAREIHHAKLCAEHWRVQAVCGHARGLDVLSHDVV